MRIQLTREEQVPAEAVKLTRDGSNAEVFVWGNANYVLVKAFVGKAQKFAHYYSFREKNGKTAVEQRDAWVERFFAQNIASVAATLKRKEEAKVLRARPHSLVVGDILYSSWGYEQTNIDFYQVVAVSEKMVEIREIASENVETTGWASGKSIGLKDQFVGEAKRYRASHDNSISLSSFASAWKWDGKPKNWTAYG